MQYTIDNKSLNEYVVREGKETFPARFWAEGAEKAVFTLAAGKEHFSWNGYPGELYEAWAPLNATAWGEEERARFARWRCAVFTPEKMDDRNLPVIFAYTGISGDYSDTAIFLRPVMKEFDCIFVAMDTHLTGIRDLADEGTPFKDRFIQSLLHLERKECVLRDDFFCEAVEELSFNACQVLSLIKQRFVLNEFPHVATIGFSLGGFYAAQLGSRLPRCFGAIGGGAAPYITNYRHWPCLVPNILYQVGKMLLPEKYAAYPAAGMAIKRIQKTPYDILKSQASMPKTRFVVGLDDKLVSAEEVQRICASNRAFLVVSVPDCGHEPCQDTADGPVLNDVGRQMVECLSSCYAFMSYFEMK